MRLRSRCLATSNEVHDEGDHRDCDKQMNRACRDLEDEQAENPDDEESQRNREEHGRLRAGEVTCACAFETAGSRRIGKGPPTPLQASCSCAMSILFIVSI